MVPIENSLENMLKNEWSQKIASLAKGPFCQGNRMNFQPDKCVNKALYNFTIYLVLNKCLIFLTMSL
jgi:hypothetical protein